MCRSLARHGGASGGFAGAFAGRTSSHGTTGEDPADATPAEKSRTRATPHGGPLRIGTLERTSALLTSSDPGVKIACVRISGSLMIRRSQVQILLTPLSKGPGDGAFLMAQPTNERMVRMSTAKRQTMSKKDLVLANQRGVELQIQA